MTEQAEAQQALVDHLVDAHGVTPWQLVQLVVTTGKLHGNLHRDPVLGPTWAHDHQ